MTERRGRNGDEEVPGRVHGAWTTPAVVVRRPDGSVVEGDEARPRVRPRRIPGAPGAVLLSPSLSEMGDGAEGRRLRRNSAPPASVSPLPPRPPARTPVVAGDEAAGGAALRGASLGGAAAGDDERTSDDAERPSRPPLAVVGAAIERSGVRHALRSVDLGRIVPEDPEARAERVARLRRIGVRVAAGVVACLTVYTVFPVRTALNLWEADHRARERQAAFDREIDILEDEVADLQTDERIELEAREQGMVRAGEESYGIMPAPAAPAPDTSSSTTVPPTTSTTRPAG